MAVSDVLRQELVVLFTCMVHCFADFFKQPVGPSLQCLLGFLDFCLHEVDLFRTGIVLVFLQSVFFDDS